MEPDDIGYPKLLVTIRREVEAAQHRAARLVSTELVSLYWRIGRQILDRQDEQGWGAQVMSRLAADLKAAFPQQRGFRVRNLAYMRAFAAAFDSESILQQPAAELPWGHIMVLLTASTPAAAALVRAAPRRERLVAGGSGASHHDRAARAGGVGT